MEKILIFILFWFSVISHCVLAQTNHYVLHIPIQGARISLDPTHIQDVPSLFVSRQINCQLVRNQGAISTLEAAEEIKYISPLIIRIKIKKNIFFNDHTPVTTADVVASFSEIKKSRTVMRNIFTWIKSIDIQNNNILIIHLKKSIPQFLTVLSSPNYAIFKKDFLLRAHKNPALWNKPIGCGGYKITSFTNKAITLYPLNSGLPIVFEILPKNQIKADELDKYDIISLQVNGQSPKMELFHIVELFDPLQIYVGLNIHSLLWKKKSDRCNFLTKLNPNILLTPYGDKAKIANDFLPQGSLGYDSTSNFLATKENNTNHSIFKPANEILSLAFLTISIPKNFLKFYYQMVHKIYPNIKLIPIKTAKKFGPTFLQKKGDVLLIGVKSNYLDAYEYFQMLSNNDANFSGYHDKKLMKKIMESQKIKDVDDRYKAYRDIVYQIEQLCLIRPLLTLPMRFIYVNKKLNVPNIGLGALNEYYLGDIRIAS